MTEKPEPLKPVRPPRTAKERVEWGRMKPAVYKDGLGRKVGGWLAGLLTIWRR
jgi:hypothetical protein